MARLPWLIRIHGVPDNEIQFLINDQLFLETLLVEVRGKSVSYSSYKKETKCKNVKRTS